jgi:hypothetical protein
MDFRKRRLAAQNRCRRRQDADAAADKARKCEQAKGRVTAHQCNGRITKYGPTASRFL